MYLKALKLQGFKSFPEPTLIEFHEGITAIVGPNGSGKSNVSDAIRWVLGEQSSKSLRAGKMAEVIFNGTETRRQMGFAEVGIVFDNSDHALPLEFDTVEITRRYYRSGESEYLINKTRCRLKDITELLADTGIGRDGYSIIGQGKVDEILSDKAEDRRHIFDEAAGIVKYRMRKQETERKLEATEQNLLRVQDVLAEVEQRLKPLERQAEKTKRYNALARQMLQLDVALTIRDVVGNRKKMQEFDKQSQNLQRDLQQAQLDKNAISQKYQSIADQLERQNDEIEARREAYSQALELAHIDERQLSKLQAQLNLLEQEEQNLTSEGEKIDQQIRDLRFDLNERDKRKADLAVSFTDFQNKISTAEAELCEVEQKFADFRPARDELLLQVDKLKEERYQLGNELFETKTFLAMQKEQQSKLQQGLSEHKSETNRADFRIEEINDQIERLRSNLERQDSELLAIRQELTSGGQKLQSSQLDLQQVEGEIGNLKYRRQTLQRLAEERAGFAQTVKLLLTDLEKQRVDASGIYGALADLLEVDAKYAQAIEVALGNQLHNIVTATRNDAVRMINYLKQERLGRATFLPLDVMSGQKLKISELASYGRYMCCLAAEAVKVEERYRPLIDGLLGRILLADNMSDALKLSELCNRRYRIVTLEGEVINAGGSMTGGRERQQRSGVLQRAAELQSLEERLAVIAERPVSIRQRIVEIEQSLAAGRASEENLVTARDENKAKLLQLEMTRQNEQGNIDTLIRRQERMQSELEQIAKLLVDRETSELQLRKRTEEIDTVLPQLEEQLVSTAGQEQELNRQRDEIKDYLTDLRISQQSIAESMRSHDELKEQLAKIVDNNRERHRAIAARQTEIVSERRDCNLQLEKLQEKQLSNDSEIQKISEQVADSEFVKEQLQAEQRDLFGKSEQITETVVNLQLAVERMQGRIERLREVEIQAKNRLWENYELSYPEAEAMEIEISDYVDADKLLKKYRQELKELGNINHAAIEEYREYRERYDFLITQSEDINRAKDDLLVVIQDLENVMSNQFAERFTQIAAHFKQVFHDLFMGGEAELSTDGDDLLTCGIEIRVQPPGKRLQSMSLLSGGERSLTAIALLFAIFKLRPAPFCVLDEVESALDDANVVRFTEYISNYTNNSQFVLITHRKGTMEAAQRLYGVTMKERGVSKLLSLQLEEA